MQTESTETTTFSKYNELYSEPAIWSQLRKELTPQIEKAFAHIKEYAGACELRDKLGLEPMARKRRVDQCMGDWRPANANQFVMAYKQLRSITHPPEAVELMRQFLAGISMRFAIDSGTLFNDAVTAVANKQQVALDEEKRFFAQAGLPHQATAITAGAGVVAAELIKMQKFWIGTIYGIVTPGEGHLGQLAADESAKWKAELAEIEASGKFSVTVNNKVRFSPEFKLNIPESSVHCLLED